MTASVSTSSITRRRASAGFPAASEPHLAALVDEALARRPELLRIDALIRAERERAARADALPDPSLSLGIQNDGFTSIEIGEMETSYLSIMASQTFPWPGKRGLRGDVARLGVDRAALDVVRARLTTEADVRRGYVALLLVRDRRALLAELRGLWLQSEQAAKARYEAGEGAQSDLLRAQLERARLVKQEWALSAEERTIVQALNRLRARPVDTPIATAERLDALPDPELGALADELADALATSPELAAARLAILRASKSTALAEKERFPDVGVSLGVMPRGDLPPMWQANVSFTLPIFAASKQDRAIAESRILEEAEGQGASAIELALAERVEARAVELRTLLDTVQLFRKGLLVQARATADSTLAQYRVGRVTFASVLEANAGYVADRDELLRTIADAQRVAIARAEVSLAPSGLGGGDGMSAGVMPGAGTVGDARATTPEAGAAASEASSSSGSMGGM
ncbi:TolC family protein [Myxococcota bacterium]|nr:TolC family protein [Myxococcota bacterium]